jgi:beta-aspartyl-dipeptidase (metallo-type)
MAGQSESSETIFTLIEHAEVYGPEPLGGPSILIANDQIIKVGQVDARQLAALDISCEVIDGEGCVVVPGFIDPHQHIMGAGGEEGFTSRMPEIPLSHEINAGITTVVGLLGTDTTTRHMQCLHAKASQFNDEGISALLYTGGFELPLRTLTDNPMDDIVMIDKIIGTGELAISDERYVDPEPHELAKVVTQTMLGGNMGGKAGITHFHVGDGKQRLALLRDLLENYQIKAKSLYPTHINRSSELMKEAIDLAKCGSHVDTDTVDENLAECWQYYRDHGGPLDKFTVSSDAHTKGGSPAKFYRQFVSCVRDHELPLEDVLPCFTSNTATVLQLKRKGRIQVHMDADLVMMDKRSLELVHVIARGRHFMKNGTIIIQSEQEQQMQEAQA